MDIQDVIKAPIISEKAEYLRETNCYAFEISLRANKTLVEKAIRKIYGLSPKKVNIVTIKGKGKQNRYGVGYRSKRKKAYVFLKKDDKIDLFEAV